MAVHDDNCSLEFDGDGCYRFAHLIREIFAYGKKNNIKVQTESEKWF